jgi:hypothetical protein
MKRQIEIVGLGVLYDGQGVRRTLAEQPEIRSATSCFNAMGTWLIVSAPPTSARCVPPLPIIPAEKIVPMKLVEQAMTSEKAGKSGVSFASNTSSRAMLESVGSGITWPQTRKSGIARAAIAAAMGADNSSAVFFAKKVPAFTNGVRKPGTRYVSLMASP